MDKQNLGFAVVAFAIIAVTFTLFGRYAGLPPRWVEALTYGFLLAAAGAAVLMFFCKNSPPDNDTDSKLPN